MYKSGEGGLKADASTAVSWYRKAAELVFCIRSPLTSRGTSRGELGWLGPDYLG